MLDIKAFCENPDWETFDELRKPELLKIANEMQAGCKASMRKQIIKNMIIDVCIDEGYWGEDMNEKKIEVQVEGMADQLEIQKLKIQAEKDIEIERIQIEIQRIQANAQLESQKIEKGIIEPKDSAKSGFDVTRHIRLVPRFSESGVESYFPHFEKIATQLNWPKASWTLLLQSVLVGKASEVYSSLSIDASADYEHVKTAILKSYELVPEFYRQKFRGTKKTPNQTHIEFARSKEQMLDRWLTAKDVSDDYQRLRQEILVEEFKQCIHTDIKTHLDESKVQTLEQAAVMSDDFALTHKLSYYSQRNPREFNRGSSHNSFSRQFGQNKLPHHNNTHNSRFNEKPKFHPTDKNDFRSGSSGGPKGHDQVTSKYGPTCAYCKKAGHTVSECYALKRKQASQPTACAVPKTLTSDCKNEMPTKMGFTESEVGFSEVREDFRPFVIEGKISLVGDDKNSKPVKMMRDTACAQTLILASALPFSEKSYTNSDVLIQSVNMEYSRVPLHQIQMKSDLVSGKVNVGIRPELPIQGVTILLGNDLAGTKVIPDPIVCETPCDIVETDEEKEIFPTCVVTRAQAKKLAQESNEQEQNKKRQKQKPEIDIPLGDTFFATIDDTTEGDIAQESQASANESEHADTGLTAQSACKQKPVQSKKVRNCNSDPITNSKLREEQNKDPTLAEFMKRSLHFSEIDEEPVCFYKNKDILMRKWRPPDASTEDDWKEVHQIVVPQVYRSEVLQIAHDHQMAGHLGIAKTQDKILRNFWWPSLKKDVSEYCKTCSVCQISGNKPNQTIPKAPLKPIPAFEEPFSRIIVDCVGPLPRTKSGHEYMLTIMCAATRFPEAIPLRNIKAPTIVRALTKFFTMVGLPRSIQSDLGSNFMSNLFQQVMLQLGIKQYKSSAYHPESQGALERFHETLKSMIRAFCFELKKDWDEGVHLLLFAVRDSVQESLGFSPFELVFGHTVRGPLQLLKEKWLNNTADLNVLDYVSNFNYRLTRVNEIAREHLRESQTKMKQWYGKKARTRVFDPGKIKSILMSEPVLNAPDFDKQFKLYVDASDNGCGAILIQENHDKVEHPVCYFSKKFNKHQKNYSTIEKECLALLFALQHFEIYVSSPKYPIVVYTDHNPLTFIHKMKNKNQRLMRWCLYLQEFILDIHHVKGRDNIFADALSRV